MIHPHAPTEYRNYNTFRVFDHYYSDRTDTNLGELDQPPAPKKRHGVLKFFAFLMLLFLIGFSLNPVLSYLLKTPYPLLVIADNQLDPWLKPDDLVLVAGVILGENIQVNDFIVYQAGADDLTLNRTSRLAIARVAAVEGNEFKAVKINSGLNTIIPAKSAIGKILGQKHPWRLPYVGRLTQWLQAGLALAAAKTF